MVVTFIEQRKKQKKLVLVFIILILSLVFILWQGVFKKPSPEGKEIKIPAPRLKKVEIDFEILENPILKELQPFEEILPLEDKIGRENPFLPY